MDYKFFDRDLSWLSFNDRVLDEAGRSNVPLLERIRFLAIYSSNLDEFYRVRIPVIRALNVLANKSKTKDRVNDHATGNFDLIQKTIAVQQQKFGAILAGEILPLLQKEKIHLVYNNTLPAEIETELNEYFYSHILGYLHPVFFTGTKNTFFPENNKLYHLVILQKESRKNQMILLNIPSDHLSRFFIVIKNDIQYIVFLDDIIRWNLNSLFAADCIITGCFSFKVTRDAGLDLQGDYGKDIVNLIEKQLAKRDQGLATRFLHEPGIPKQYLELAAKKLSLSSPGIVEGGRYHNLRDFFALPVKNKQLEYEKWPPLRHKSIPDAGRIFDTITDTDLLIHPPYHSYDPVLRFFNEAATNPDTTEICTSIYRVASDSRIANALVTAALNGKKVQVLIELKARFDEANNIKWAKQMKQAGVNIIYSSKKIKVHGKIALVKKKNGKDIQYYGLLATGNFNEGTATIYTDFILMTAARPILLELEKLFKLLADENKVKNDEKKPFKEFLVARYNLKDRFVALIDREIAHAKSYRPAEITIKLNNLEERDLISKLYEASSAGVKISLIVRSICCIIPGVSGMSENITVTRIIDRYLEHSRVFIFNNNNDPEVFLGSADWMNRNIYHRIEVCFPVLNKDIREQVIKIVALQLADNSQAVIVDSQLKNIIKTIGSTVVQSQKEIYRLLALDK